MAKLIDRDEALAILFPLGIPPEWNAGDWDYCVSARAIYKAIMKCKVTELEEKKGEPITKVGFSLTARRAFGSAGITTVEEVLELEYGEILHLRGIGPTNAGKIIEALEKKGYNCAKLRAEEAYWAAELK